MTLAEAIVFGVEQAVEILLEKLHEHGHQERATYVEAARILEEFAKPYYLDLLPDLDRVGEQETTDGR